MKDKYQSFITYLKAKTHCPIGCIKLNAKQIRSKLKSNFDKLLLHFQILNQDQQISNFNNSSNFEGNINSFFLGDDDNNNKDSDDDNNNSIEKIFSSSMSNNKDSDDENIPMTDKSNNSNKDSDDENIPMTDKSNNSNKDSDDENIPMTDKSNNSNKDIDSDDEMKNNNSGYDIKITKHPQVGQVIKFFNTRFGMIVYICSLHNVLVAYIKNYFYLFRFSYFQSNYPIAKNFVSDPFPDGHKQYSIFKCFISVQ